MHTSYCKIRSKHTYRKAIHTNNIPSHNVKGHDRKAARWMHNGFFTYSNTPSNMPKQTSYTNSHLPKNENRPTIVVQGLT